jgi:hypothetical protein
MKKIIFLFLVLFTSILIVKAENTFYLNNQISDMYIQVFNGGKVKNITPEIIYKNDSSIIYSLNPFEELNVNSQYRVYNYNDSISNISDNLLDKINVISYYGYGYQNHTDIRWYGITQFLIWKTLGVDDIYFTDKNGNKIFEYEEEIYELESLVNSHYLLPSFANNTYTYGPNKNYELIDNNNLISYYEIIESKIDINIEQNKLKFKTGDDGIYNITFSKSSPINQEFILYNNEEGSILILPGKINDVTFTTTIKVLSGTIIINRYDNENKDRLEATLVGSKIGVYKNNRLISVLTIDENGTAEIEGLELGMYTLNERDDITGYNLSLYTHTVYITEYERTKIVSWGSSVIEGNIIINKYYGKENDYKLDENAVFEVYHNNKLIKTLKPINGIIKEKLEYGTYTIKQVSGVKYYNLSEEFTVKIDDNKDYTYNLYTDMDEDLNNFLLSKEYEFLLKENELNNLKELLNQEKNSLINLKNQLMEKEEKLNKQKELLKQDREKLEKLKEEINIDYLNIDIKKEELDLKERELNKLKNDLDIFSNTLDIRGFDLTKLQLDIKKKEDELKKYKEELDLLNDKLSEKENRLIYLERDIKSKELELKNREDSIIKLQNKIDEENVLIVEVPNTYKKNNNKLISKIMIFIGTILIILSKRKVTNR